MVSLLSHRDRAGYDPRHQPGHGHVLGHVALEFHGDHGRVHPRVHRRGFLVGGDPRTQAPVLERGTAQRGVVVTGTGLNLTHSHTWVWMDSLPSEATDLQNKPASMAHLHGLV